MGFIAIIFTIMVSLLCICVVRICFENMYDDVNYTY